MNSLSATASSYNGTKNMYLKGGGFESVGNGVKAPLV